MPMHPIKARQLSNTQKTEQYSLRMVRRQPSNQVLLSVVLPSWMVTYPRGLRVMGGVSAGETVPNCPVIGKLMGSASLILCLVH